MGSKIGTREIGTRSRVLAVFGKAPCDDKAKGEGGNRSGQVLRCEGKGRGGVDCLLQSPQRVTFLRIGKQSLWYVRTYVNFIFSSILVRDHEGKVERTLKRIIKSASNCVGQRAYVPFSHSSSSSSALQ